MKAGATCSADCRLTMCDWDLPWCLPSNEPRASFAAARRWAGIALAAIVVSRVGVEREEERSEAGKESEVRSRIENATEKRGPLKAKGGGLPQVASISLGRKPHDDKLPSLTAGRRRGEATYQGRLKQDTAREETSRRETRNKYTESGGEREVGGVT